MFLLSNNNWNKYPYQSLESQPPSDLYEYVQTRHKEHGTNYPHIKIHTKMTTSNSQDNKRLCFINLVRIYVWNKYFDKIAKIQNVHE